MFIGGFGLLLCFFSPLAFALNYPPYNGTITPATGTSVAGQTLSFTTTFSDRNGYQNIQSADFLINISAYGAMCFYGHYDQNENKLYLRNDKNNAWLGGFTPGENQIIANSFAKINCAQSSASGSNQTLTIKWSITFSSKFIGQKNMYLYVKDDVGIFSNWQKRGFWTILPDSLSPTGSIKINNDSPYTNSTAVTLSLFAQDNPGGSGLDLMQFSNEKTAWSSPENYATTKSWALSSNDGKKAVSVRFSDKAGNWSKTKIADTIILDTAPPTGSILINNGETVSNSQDVTLTLSANDFASADSFTKLLLHADGTNGSIDFIDNSQSHHSITAYGNSRLDTSQTKFGSAAAFFDGDGDYLSLADSADWNFASEDFTIDFWVKFNTLPASGSYQMLCSQISDSAHYVYLAVKNSSGAYQLTFYVNNPSYAIDVAANTNPNFSTGVWCHIALVRTGNIFKIFQDGIQIGADAVDSDVVSDIDAPFEIGRWNHSGAYFYFDGWLDEIRISKGIARWTANFTPANAPYGGGLASGMGSGAQMRFSNDNTSWSAPQDYAAATAWILAGASGEKTVYAKFKDAAGNWSNAFSDKITLDLNVVTTTTVDYTYDDLNRLNSETSTSGRNSAYTYDEVGNIERKDTK
jgi:YD repeat-containing protein